MSDRDGGPAFPIPESDHSQGQTGMTLRQWYAGQALPGLILRTDKETDYYVVGEAFECADAMIAFEREEEADRSDP